MLTIKIRSSAVWIISCFKYSIYKKSRLISEEKTQNNNLKKKFEGKEDLVRDLTPKQEQEGLSQISNKIDFKE